MLGINRNFSALGLAVVAATIGVACSSEGGNGGDPRRNPLGNAGGSGGAGSDAAGSGGESSGGSGGSGGEGLTGSLPFEGTPVMADEEFVRAAAAIQETVQAEPVPA